MAGTVTNHNSDHQAIERELITLAFTYVAPIGITTSEELTLRAMPAGVRVVCIETQNVVADQGTATSKINIKWGSTALFTGSADSGATVNTIDDGVGSGSFLANADTSAAANLIVDYDMTGTTTVAGPSWRIYVTCYRESF